MVWWRKLSHSYLLDDPLSAVDAHVGKHIFRECVKGLLKKKCVVLVTHALEYLPVCDNVIVLEKGAVEDAGTFEQVSAKQEGVLAGLLAAQKEAKEQEGGKEEKEESPIELSPLEEEKNETSTYLVFHGKNNAEDTSTIFRGDGPKSRRGACRYSRLFTPRQSTLHTRSDSESGKKTICTGIKTGGIHSDPIRFRRALLWSEGVSLDDVSCYVEQDGKSKTALHLIGCAFRCLDRFTTPFSVTRKQSIV